MSIQPNPLRRVRARVGLLAILAVTMFGSVALVASTPVAAAEAQPATVVKPMRNFCGYTNSEPILRRGSQGTAVKELQCQLNNAFDLRRHRPLDVDGFFGPLTEDAVYTFQSCAGIGVDGIVGPETWTYLYSWASSVYAVC